MINRVSFTKVVSLVLVFVLAFGMAATGFAAEPAQAVYADGEAVQNVEPLALSQDEDFEISVADTEVIAQEDIVIPPEDLDESVQDAQRQADYTVEGQVFYMKSASTPQTITDARVKLTLGDKTFKGQTVTDGIFSFTGVPETTGTGYTLEVLHRDFQIKTVSNITVLDNMLYKDGKHVSVEMTPLTVTGSVTDREDGTALDGAVVEFTDSDESEGRISDVFTGYTDDSVSNNYKIFPMAGYYPAAADVNVFNPVTYNATAKMDGYCTETVENIATVKHNDTTAVFNALPIKMDKLKVNLKVYLGLISKVTQIPVTSDTAHDEQMVRLLLPDGSYMTPTTMTTAVENFPDPNDPNNTIPTTVYTGFEFKGGIVNGDYKLIVQVDKYNEHIESFNVDFAGEHIDLGNVVLSPTYIKGSVKNLKNTGLTGAKVKLFKAADFKAATAATDVPYMECWAGAGGSYEFLNVENGKYNAVTKEYATGEYIVWYSHDGYWEDYTKTSVQIKYSSKDLGEKILLPIEGSVGVQAAVQKSGGAVAEGARVTLYDADMKPVSGKSMTITSSKPTFLFDGLVPGDYSIKVALADYALSYTKVSLIEDITTLSNIVLSPKTSIDFTGWVLDANNTMTKNGKTVPLPVKEVTVNLYTDFYGKPVKTTVTDVDGKFSFSFGDSSELPKGRSLYLKTEYTTITYGENNQTGNNLSGHYMYPATETDFMFMNYDEDMLYININSQKADNGISGTLKVYADPVPKVLANADVKLVHIYDGVFAEGKTDSNGVYKFTKVPVGIYTLYVSLKDVTNDYERCGVIEVTGEKDLIGQDYTVNPYQPKYGVQGSVGTPQIVENAAVSDGIRVELWTDGKDNWMEEYIMSGEAGVYNFPKVAAGTYKLIVPDAIRGNYKVIGNSSKPTTIKVVDKNIDAPNIPIELKKIVEITKHPKTASFYAGNKASFTTKAEGIGPFTYQWQVKEPVRGSVFEDIDGATNTTLETDLLNKSQTGAQYRCKVTCPDLVDGVYTDAAVLTVLQPVTMVSFDQITKNISVNSSFTLFPTVDPSDAENRALLWKSNNPEIAIVDSQGKVTGLKIGSTTVVATAADGNGAEAVCTVNVIEPVTNIALDKNTVTCFAKSLVTLTPTVTPEDASIKTIRWSSSDPSVASVSQEGVITSKKKGVVSITAYSTDGTNIYAKCTLTVKQPVTKIKLSQRYVTLNAGSKYTVNVTTVHPSNANNKELEWKTRNSKVATVDSTGRVTAVKAGKTDIIAKAKDGSNTFARITVTVNSLVKSVKMAQPKVYIKKGNSVAVGCTVYTNDGATVKPKWTSSNTKVATVSSSGKITAKKGGTAVIRATATGGNGSKTASLTVVVTGGEKNVKKVTVSGKPSKNQLKIGAKKQLTAKFSPSNATGAAITWVSSNSKICSVDKAGKITGRRAGVAYITAKAGGKSSTRLKITVVK